MTTEEKVKDFLRDADNQLKAMSYFLGFTVSSKNICSPFRIDKHPSCAFYFAPSGVLYLHDFATDEQFDVISVVRKKHPNLSYNQSLELIEANIPVIDKSVLESSLERNSSLLEYVLSSKDSTAHINYFKQYHISKETLEKFRVKDARAIYKDSKLVARATEKNPIFIYDFLEGTFKGYRPLAPNKEGKWWGNASLTTIQGWHMLPKKGKVAIITSSLKDAMVLYELGLPAIAFNSEALPTRERSQAFQTVKTIIDSLKERFEYVILFMDNDAVGRKYNETLSKAYSIPAMCIPMDYKEKDISDFIKIYNKEKTFKLLKKLLRNVTKKSIRFPKLILDTELANHDSSRGFHN